MDYLCELPNDAARRIALDSLPPDLNSTYERILSRVNQSNPEIQQMVRRALRWVTASTCPTIEALCEAVSIDFGTTRRNPQAIPDEFEILHWCSSLVRKSAHGRRLELAHFTVKEFLLHIDPRRDISIGPYLNDPRNYDLIRAKVCLTYLYFEDFDQGGSFSQHKVNRRTLDYSFRPYAVLAWGLVARENLDNPELFSLMQKLLNPSKPNTLVSWVQDFVQLNWHHWGMPVEDEVNLSIINSGFVEATALHYAAMFRFTKLCNWLIRSGCDVNQNTSLGTPLHCALLQWDVFHGKINEAAVLNRMDESDRDSLHDTIDLFLDSGADPNCYYHAGTRNLSPLLIALDSGYWGLAVRLLDKDAVLDSDCLDELEGRLHELEGHHELERHHELENIRTIVGHTANQNLPQENHNRLLQLALKTKTSNVTRLVTTNSDVPYPKKHLERVLRTAAEFGQSGAVIHVLEDQKLDVDAADESTGLTALHHAARTDQFSVVQILVDRGADLTRSDNLGWTALHHSVQRRDARCVHLLLDRNADTGLRDLEGMTVWHLAAQEGHIQALRLLLIASADSASAVNLKANDGRTPLLCASASGSTETIRLLLSAGSSVTETGLDGASSLHYAAESGSLEGIRFLIEQGIDPCVVTNDGSSAIHYSIRGDRENLAEVVHILLENGVNPCQARNDECTPLHNLVSIIKEDSSSSGELDQLFTAGRTLLKKILEKSKSAPNVRLGSELIYLACSQSFSTAYETVLALLELGMDCDVRFADGKTALMAAAEKGNGDIFSTLLLHGADPCISNSGLNAHHFACLNDHKNILVRLKGTSIDWNSKASAQIMGVPRGNVTALHIAAEREDSSVLEYLLDQGVISNIDAQTDIGETPLSVAVWKRAPRICLCCCRTAQTLLSLINGAIV